MNYIKHLLLAIAFIIFQITNLTAESDEEKKPRLVIGIIIDHMQNQYFERYAGDFSEKGFKKLINNGVYCKNARSNYFISGYPQGYATIATGKYPSVHGIVANEWYNRTEDRMTHCTRDEKVKTLEGSFNSGKYSPHMMLEPTFSDYIKYHDIHNKSKVIGISADNQGAILTTGFSGDAAYWFDPVFGKWITNTYYKDSIPPWVHEFNQKKLPDTYLDREWKPLLPAGDYQESMNDNNPFEKGIGNQHTFPYDLANMKRISNNYELLKYIPAGNTFVKDFALYAMENEQLGRDEHTDVLMINFPAVRYIDQLYGPKSLEMQDVWLRLDKDIAHFLEYIDEHIGIEHTLLFITSSYTPSEYMPYVRKSKMPSAYFRINKSWIILETYLNAVYGSKKWLTQYHNQMFYLDRHLIEDNDIDLSSMQDRIANFLIDFSSIANAYPAYKLKYPSCTQSEYSELQNGHHNKRSGDVYFTLTSGVQVKQLDILTRHTWGNIVPLLWYGGGIKPQVIHRNVNITDISPTILFLLNMLPNGQFQGETIVEFKK